jgi:uncharacterized protein (DUF1697 family)
MSPRSRLKDRTKSTDVALVAFLRGLNVGGHRTFRPTTLAEQLQHLGVINLGAAGTFVIQRPIGREPLRAEIARRLPFEAEIIICQGRDITRLLAKEFFAGYPMRSDTVRFVSIMSRPARSAPALPVNFPPSGKWLLRVLARENRFVLGVYRRHMKVIGCLNGLDRLFGVPLTTRNWNTITAIAKLLETRARGR